MTTCDEEEEDAEVLATHEKDAPPSCATTVGAARSRRDARRRSDIYLGHPRCLGESVKNLAKWEAEESGWEAESGSDGPIFYFSIFALHFDVDIPTSPLLGEALPESRVARELGSVL